jgi:hypothetical protein
MHRIIDGTLYARNSAPYAHDIKVHDLGHGHLEAVVLPRYGWSEVGALSALALRDYESLLRAPPPLTDSEQLAKLTENRERATRRARTKVRRLAKTKGLTTLLTLTYRENMLDRERMARDLDVFLKRVRRVISGFQYIAVFERQKRGAWHAHLAVEKVLSHYLAGGKMVRSYDLLRSMWRGVVGQDNGNVDVSRNKRVQRSAAKLAAYLSKYIGKTFDQSEKHVNAYSASGRALPKALVFRSTGGQLWHAIGDLYDLIQLEVSASELFNTACDGGGWFVCLSPPERPTCARS